MPGAQVEERLERAAVLSFADKHGSGYHTSQGLACFLLFMAPTGLCLGSSNPFPRDGYRTTVKPHNHR